MSTNANIIVKHPEKDEWTSIYVHWDGYLEHVGRILLDHYNSYEKALELVKLGDISSLNSRLSPDVGEQHSFEKPAPDVTVAYHRDRGEEYSVNTSFIFSEHCKMEYCYLFKDGKWFWKNKFRHTDFGEIVESNFNYSR